MDAPTNSVFSSPVTHLLSVLCVLMKILSHTSVKKKTKRLRGSNFTLLLVIFKWHHGSEGVNVLSTTQGHLRTKRSLGAILNRIKLVSNWILMSCQPHRVTSRQSVVWGLSWIGQNETNKMFTDTNSAWTTNNTINYTMHLCHVKT